MSDTRQCVSWALERKCPFRSGDDWFLPGPTSTQLFDLKCVDSALRDNRVIGPICVTSWLTTSDSENNSHRIPHDGFNINERLACFGGYAHMAETCQTCEANVQVDGESTVAGCSGDVEIWPDSEELDQALWDVINQRGLESQLRTLFPVTTPLWYGFWINSPLQRPQAEFLHELLSAVWDVDEAEDKDLRTFLKALETAIRWELPVHVSLPPLGHADMGYFTVFPHCPRCKANAPVGRWKQSYPTEPHVCEVCGEIFIPNEHHHVSELDESDWSDNSLEKQLGPEGYTQFVRDFLFQQGSPSAQVDDIVDNANDGPLLRQIMAMRLKRNATLLRLRESSDPRPSEPLTITLAPGVAMEFVTIPAGEFLMGSPNAEENSTESPQHPVRIARSFLIGRFPVTQAQWAALMNATRSKHPGNPQHPVDRVSWFDCQEFCEALCQRFGRIFRLPSEAEWEYACRAGTTTKYAFGDVLSTDQANFTSSATMFRTPPDDDDADEVVSILMDMPEEDDSPADSRATPCAVGSYPPNAWGIYDMHGNVNEWCEDVWHPNYSDAPADGSA